MVFLSFTRSGTCFANQNSITTLHLWGPTPKQVELLGAERDDGAQWERNKSIGVETNIYMYMYMYMYNIHRYMYMYNDIYILVTVYLLGWFEFPSPKMNTAILRDSQISWMGVSRNLPWLLKNHFWMVFCKERSFPIAPLMTGASVFEVKRRPRAARENVMVIDFRSPSVWFKVWVKTHKLCLMNIQKSSKISRILHLALAAVVREAGPCCRHWCCSRGLQPWADDRCT